MQEFSVRRPVYILSYLSFCHYGGVFLVLQLQGRDSLYISEVSNTQ